MPLYGNELDRDTSPLEAGLGWCVQLDHAFVGREALVARLPASRVDGSSDWCCAAAPSLATATR